MYVPGGHPSPPLSPGPADRARFELLTDPWRSNRIIAGLAGCHVDTVHRARRELEERGVIDQVGAWERRRRTDPHAHQDHDAQRIELPPMPASMQTGLCASGKYDPDTWHPGRYDHATRQQALALCRQCPALCSCREWSMQLATSDKYAIYGGMTANQRARAQRTQQAGH